MDFFADGVLPDEVSRDTAAGSWLVFVDLAPGTDVKAWLQQVATPAVQGLLARPVDGAAVATCTTSFGAGLFDKAALVPQRPLGLAAPLPAQAQAVAVPHDVLFYVFSRFDATVARFLRALSAGAGTMRLELERGYQRADKREVFGQPDGLRNVGSADRAGVAFLGDQQAGEPLWAVGGSYLAYLKVVQHVPAWTSLTPDQQAQIIGRRADGSRLDLPVGTSSRDEPSYTDPATPSACSHVRKAGPRGPNQDPVRILRRGTPFVDVDANGMLEEGLQFVSYQASVDDFLTILQRWMLNPDFPTLGAKIDSLFDPATGLTTITKAGLYFAVPHDDRFLGAGLFDSNEAGGELVIRLTVQDPSSGQPNPTASLEDATFQVTGPAGALATLTTDAAGHAHASGLPVGVSLTVTQTAPPTGAQIGPGQASQAIEIEPCTPKLLQITDTRSGSGY